MTVIFPEQLQQAGSALHVTIMGEFNGSRAGTLLDAVMPHLGGPSRSIVLDLTATDYIDSSGLWEIATVRIRASRADKSLSMQVCQGSRMAYIIRSTCFQPTIPVVQIALVPESEAPSAKPASPVEAQQGPDPLKPMYRKIEG